MNKLLLVSCATLVSLSASAQSWHEGDVKWVNSQKFPENVATWNETHSLGEDDNFFISRVKPRLRFQNNATQIRENLKWEVNDKRLCAWLPININSEGNMNALPTGRYDSECFTMWSYVDHWGNWSCPLGGIPGAFTDVAHKNGITVSSVAAIPYGAISAEWSGVLDRMGALDPAQAAKMLVYYGHDGIGYNSEFAGYNRIENIRQLHQGLIKNINSLYDKVTPGYNMAENMWYDGTSSNTIQFDLGLDAHNIGNWGALGEERASLFLNYNWNKTSLLTKSIKNAASETMGKGRNPLYLYCGINMQGGEPAGNSWPLLVSKNLSIGLWGAHSDNMFWEARGEAGSSPEVKQQRYQHRIENWFSGGTHNPASCPVPKSVVICSGDDVDFHGMSTFMSARSTMGWNLDDEPFYSYFNIGNGRFLNWKGERQNDSEWYNIGVQDFMPTWRWWFTNTFLAKKKDYVVNNGLSAEFTWNDAYVGGSCLRVFGSTKEEYLHLFKTNYDLKAGDLITFRYKLVGGSTDADLVLAVNGNESQIAKTISLCTKAYMYDDGTWVEKTYEVTNGDGLDRNAMAVVALRFANSDNMDFYAGEFSVKRSKSPVPVTPEIKSVKILRNTHAGVDAKIIFNVPNNKPADEVCYNSDVNVSMFKVWAQEEGCEPVLMALTTSWASLCYSTPFDGDSEGNGKIRYGVSAVALDTDSDSEIAWSEYMDAGERSYIDNITIDKTTITPDEEFTLSAVDAKRNFHWAICKAGETTPVATSDEYLNAWECDGLSDLGSYDLLVTRNDGTVITHPSYIMVTDAARGRLPRIETLTANGADADIDVMAGEEIELAYTGRVADGTTSRGIAIKERFFGVRVSEVLEREDQSFSIAGWLKINDFPGGVNFIDIVDRNDLWPRNNWGWLWSSLNSDGTLQNYDQDYSAVNKGETTHSIKYDFGNNNTILFNKGQWTHFAMVFDRNSNHTRTLLYINGKLIPSTWQYLSGGSILSQGTTEEYINAYKGLRLTNHILLGGTRHAARADGGNGFSGTLDDFQIWNKPMSQDDVMLSMQGIKQDNLPEGLVAYWDFETSPESDNSLIAKGPAGAKGGYLNQVSNDGSEGQGAFAFLEPNFVSGCPVIEPTDYKVSTVPSWKARLGNISEVTGNDTEGTAKLSFNRHGDEYTATLTLSNDLGSDSRTFQFIKVTGDVDGIAGVNPDDELRTYLIDDVLFLDIAKDGFYDVNIYGINGQTVASLRQNVTAGNFLRLTVNGDSGVYVVNVLRDGMSAKTFKMIKK